LKTHAIIFGIKSFKLNLNEINFFKEYKPWGIILFSRNINNLEQVRNLTFSIRDIFKDKNFPILIDQEGGKVNRFRKIINLDKYYTLSILAISIEIIIYFIRNLINFLK